MSRRFESTRRVYPLVDTSDLRASIRRLEAHAKERPEDAATVQERLAYCYVNLGVKAWWKWRKLRYFSRAAAHCRRAIELNPDDSRALRRLANISAEPEQQSLIEQADELDRRIGLIPPKSARDAAGWDRYWQYQIDEDLEDGWFYFELAPVLVPAFLAAGFHTLLDVGCGVSMEPGAFAWAGFAVTGLELSPVAVEHGSARPFTEQHAHRFFGEQAQALRRSGGRVDYVVGDFLDADVCPGSYDVVLTRRTVQHYRGEPLSTALAALVRRLSPSGVLVIHFHNAYDVLYDAEALLKEAGFEVIYLGPDNQESLPHRPKLAYFFGSSG